MSGLHQERDALDPPSAHHAIDANPVLTSDPPPQSPSLPVLSITDADVDIVDHPLREPNAEHTGDHLPGPSGNQYYIV